MKLLPNLVQTFLNKSWNFDKIVFSDATVIFREIYLSRTPKAYIQPGFVKDPSPSAGKGVGRDPWDYTHLGRTGGWESGWLLLWRLVGSSWRRNGNGTPWKGNSRFGMIPILRKQLCCRIVYGCWMRYTAQRLWTPANKIQDQLLPSTD